MYAEFPRKGRHSSSESDSDSELYNRIWELKRDINNLDSHKRRRNDFDNASSSRSNEGQRRRDDFDATRSSEVERRRNDYENASLSRSTEVERREISREKWRGTHGSYVENAMISSEVERREISKEKWRDVPGSSQQTLIIREHYEVIDSDDEINENRGIPASKATSRDLDEDILALLGGVVTTQKKSLGEPLMPAVVDRWTSIMKNGLPVDESAAIIQKYPPPSNCLPLRPPKLNMVVAKSVAESVSRRDKRLEGLQTLIGTSLTAIGHVVTALLEDETGVNKARNYIQPLSDAARLLCDVHHSETQSRRELVMYNLAKELKEPLSQSPVDEWLFGADINETLNASRDRKSGSWSLKLKTNQAKNSYPRNSKPQGAPLFRGGHSGHQYPKNISQNYKSWAARKEQGGRISKAYRRWEEK